MRTADDVRTELGPAGQGRSQVEINAGALNRELDDYPPSPDVSGAVSKGVEQLRFI
jgi:hypothetical protein